MKVLVDTNVVADFLATREPFYENSAKLMQRCASGELKGYIAFHSVPSMFLRIKRDRIKPVNTAWDIRA